MMDSILAAKEDRWARKLALAKSLAAAGAGQPAALAVLTLRMPAPLRTSVRYSATALSLHAAFARLLGEKGIRPLHEEFRISGDGPESYFAAALDPIEFKRLAVGWEEAHPWGALADLDLMDSRGAPIGRADLGLPPRSCLVCGEDAAVCVIGRRHELATIEARVEEILLRPEQEEEADDARIGRLALAATLFEVSAGPKPGLVDPFSKGAHRDMDYQTFLSSAAAIGPWFTVFARLGRRYGDELGALLPALRNAGKAAERAMFAATGGVNTHKGLIFSMGLLCAAAGRLAAAGGGFSNAALTSRAVASAASAIVKGICARDFGDLPTGSTALTTGEKLYLSYGVRGIRGEAEDGFPSLLEEALPRLQADLSAGLSMNDAMVDALLVLYGVVEDTNVLGRAGRGGLEFLRSGASRALGLGGMATPEGRAAVQTLAAGLVERNISPGGCADLLALAVFLNLLEGD